MMECIKNVDKGKKSAMSDPSLKKQTFNGVIWRILEVGGTHIIQLVIGIVLARLIMPEQFAAIAMLSIFLAVAQVFINSGFSTALMRKNDRTQVDCSTVFYFNIVIAIISYIILYFAAPLVAYFYDLPELESILRVSAIALIIGSTAGVHRTLLSARMDFKSLAKYNISALIISGCVGMYMAYKGFQVWALVAQSIVSTVVNTLFIWFASPWRPTWQFSWISFKEFFSFGSKLLASGLLDTLYTNMYSVVIGKIFPHSDLAFYNRAAGLKNMASSTPTSVLQSVTFPALCKLQGSDDTLRSAYRRMLRVSAFVIFPLCLGIGGVSFPLINVLYTNVWIYAATLLQIIVFAGMWYPIHAINLNLLQVKGRSDLFFRLEVIKKIIGVAMLCATVPIGLKAMCYGGIITSIFCLVINTHYTGKLLNLGFFTQMKDLLPSLVLSIVMFTGCKFLSTVLGNGILSLVGSIAEGTVIYLGGAIIFRFTEFKELKNLRQ